MAKYYIRPTEWAAERDKELSVSKKFSIRCAKRAETTHNTEEFLAYAKGALTAEANGGLIAEPLAFSAFNRKTGSVEKRIMATLVIGPHVLRDRKERAPEAAKELVELLRNKQLFNQLSDSKFHVYLARTQDDVENDRKYDSIAVDYPILPYVPVFEAGPYYLYVRTILPRHGNSKPVVYKKTRYLVVSKDGTLEYTDWQH